MVKYKKYKEGFYEVADYLKEYDPELNSIELIPTDDGFEE